MIDTTDALAVGDLDTDERGPALAALFAARAPGRASGGLFTLLVAVLLVAMTTALCWASRDWLSPQACCLVYLALTVAAGALGSPALPLPLALLGLLAWNFFFTAPHFTLFIDAPEDRVLFGVFAVVAVTQYRLVANLRRRERESRLAEARALLLVDLRAALEVGEPARALKRLGDALAARAELLPPDDAQPPAPDAVDRSLHHLWRGDIEVRDRALTAPLMSPSARHGLLRLEFSRPVAVSPEGERLVRDAATLLTAHLERRQLAADAERARETALSEKLGRTLLDHVTHEMKTPATIILAALHELRPALRGEAAVRPGTVTALEEAAWRMHLVTDELTARAGISAGLLRPEPEVADAAELVRELLARLASEGQRARLRVLDHAAEAHVRTDPALLGSILAQLVSNALRHAPAESLVEIELRATPDRVTIAVRDHGPGLGDDDPARHFERHRSGDNPGVLGLGLTIARDFARMLGGELLAANAPEGGATFTVSLPRVPKPQLD